MSEESEIVYQDGEIVWVKLGSCWWPGEVVAIEKLPPDLFSAFKKPPIAVVKFFQEDTYEYVKNPTSIYKYNCSRKDEFINKGLYMYRTKHGPMEKFPEDVIRAEIATGGDIEILTRDEFQETKKESYTGLFGTPKNKNATGSSKKGQGRKTSESSFRPRRMGMKDKSDYKVHILLQGGNTPEHAGTVAEPSTSVNETITPKKAEPSTTTYSTPTTQSGLYSCHACSFTTSRLNVMILHNKTHSATFIPYTPSPIRKNIVRKSIPQSTELVKHTETKTPKARRPRKEKPEKVFKKPSGQKRLAEETKIDDVVKKPKTEEEIKSSLLADWEDVEDNCDSETSVIVEKFFTLVDESPAEPTPAELPSAQVPEEISPTNDKKSDDLSPEEKPESSSSKYDFCEDEDWPEEADIGRKIPRVKNPSKRKDDAKTVSLDDDEMTREVAELLSKTTMPELPSAPEPLKVEENFPEPSLVKSPDKNIQCVSDMSRSLDKPATEAPPTKAIFKTKTFFRSRHSRSQDAIGKYVAEQLNAAERMDCDAEINGADTVSSLEARESPIEHIKVARLAPKIQLKKMKAEAAQLREKDKINPEHLVEDVFSNFAIKSNKAENLVSPIINEKKEYHTPKHVLIYPNREIKPMLEEAQKEILNDIPVDEKKPHLETAKIENIEKAETTDDIKDNFVSVVNKTEGEVSLVSLPFDKKINADLEVSVEISENYEEPLDRFMNESTASAVDALLSVSRETDRVTKHISDDPPEDLFEDDSTAHNINGFQEKIVEDLLYDNDSKQNEGAYKPVKDNENINEDISQDVLSEGVSVKENTPMDISHEKQIADMEPIIKPDNIPSESDLQIAETLINLPSTAIQNKTLDDSKEIHPVCSSIDGDLKEQVIETSENNVYTENSENATNFVTSENTSNIEISETIMKTIENTVDIKTSENNLVVEQVNLILETPEDVVETSQINLIDETPEKNLVVETSENNLVLKNSETSTIVESSKSVAVTEIPGIDMTFDSNKSLKRDNKILNYEISSSSHISKSRTMNIRFETEQEKSENLNAAQSLVQMSESIVDTSPVSEVGVSTAKVFSPKVRNGVEKSVKNQNIELLENKNNNSTPTNGNVINFDTNSSKLLKILEEPSKLKVHTQSDKLNNATPANRVIVTEKERILNFDVGKLATKGKTQSPKQKIIIRRATTNKSVLTNLSEASSSNKLVLACNNNSEHEGSPVTTYTIRASSDTSTDPNTIVIQPKLRKIKSCAKVQKLNPQASLITPLKELKSTTKISASDDTFFDINSMPVVLSDDILTPESIEKMPIVMTDGNIISSSHSSKIVKQKQTIAGNEKTAISPLTYKQEMKTLLMNPVESNKITTPNILSKSAKLRAGKPMLIIDKTTGKQKIIMSKPEPPVSELKQQTKLHQTPQPTTQPVAKTEQFIILPSASTGRPGRAQKIVIDPQTGRAHVIVTKGTDTSANETKSVSTKLIPPLSEASSSSNTVMIITNAQGAQSRIVLTPEHEKILFPNKQQPNISQLKAITTQRTNTLTLQPKITPIGTQVKTQTKIVPKPKSTIITSKGQLLVGSRVTNSVQNMVPMSEIRAAPKRLIATEPKKLVQAIKKSNSEPMIILQQKPGTVMQLTAAQFEHLQRTGQLVASRPNSENKIIIQKSITIPPGESIVKSTVKQRTRKTVVESHTPVKRMKQEIALAPAPVLSTPMPTLTPLSNTAQGTAHVFATSSTAPSLTTTNTYSDLEHLDEILPSTAIARHPEPVLAPAPPDLHVTGSVSALAPVPTIVPAPAPVPAPLTDGQLVAVPGESFGGPQASFYLCIEENGTLTPIDHRPLILENNQLVPMTVDPLPVLAPQPERRDILEAALANSDVFHADAPRDEAPDFRDLNANVSVHCRVSETSTTLNQPIMTPVEMPTKVDSEPAVPSNLEDGLAVIGVTAHTVPTSLELPITVTDPRIAPKTTDPLSNNNYGAALLTPSTADMSFVTTEETEASLAGPISMPLLTEEESVGKSMPLLTDDISERAVSSVESTVDSLCSEAEVEVGMGPFIAPGSDCSENSANSAEIPLQPAIMLSANDLARDS